MLGYNTALRQFFSSLYFVSFKTIVFVTNLSIASVRGALGRNLSILTIELTAIGFFRFICD